MVGWNYSAKERSGFKLAKKLHQSRGKVTKNPAATLKFDIDGKLCQQFKYQDIVDENGDVRVFDPETGKYMKVLAWDDDVDKEEAVGYLYAWSASKGGRKFIRQQEGEMAKLQKKFPSGFNSQKFARAFKKQLQNALQAEYACGNMLYENLDLDLNIFVRTAQAFNSVYEGRGTQQDLEYIVEHQMGTIHAFIHSMPKQAELDAITQFVGQLMDKAEENEALTEAAMQYINEYGEDIRLLKRRVDDHDNRIVNLEVGVDNLADVSINHGDRITVLEDLFNQNLHVSATPSKSTKTAKSSKSAHQARSILEDLLTATPDYKQVLRFEDACLMKQVSELLTGKELSTLEVGEWISDAVLNPFLKIICTKLPGRKAHAFSSHFFEKLFGNHHRARFSYDSVARWSKKLGSIFEELELLFVPVNISRVHWALLIVDMNEQTVYAYDSLGIKKSKYLRGMMMYLQEEHKRVHKRDLPAQWTTKDMYRDATLPKQGKNTNDCAVFVCAYAYHKKLDLAFDHVWKSGWQNAITANNVRTLIGLTLIDG